MSEKLTVYIGPYIRCQNPPKAVVVQLLRCPKCERNVTTPFCGECGSASEKYDSKHRGPSVTDKDRYLAFRDAGLDPDDMTHVVAQAKHGQADCFYCEHRGSPGFKFIPEEYGGAAIWQPEPEKEKLQLSFACIEAIEVLKNLYGEDNVLIVYGILCHAR